jgi:hypothetical protein
VFNFSFAAPLTLGAEVSSGASGRFFCISWARRSYRGTLRRLAKHREFLQFNML